MTSAHTVKRLVALVSFLDTDSNPTSCLLRSSRTPPGFLKTPRLPYFVCNINPVFERTLCGTCCGYGKL